LSSLKGRKIDGLVRGAPLCLLPGGFLLKAEG
jgi:hypothetical protein